MMDILSTPTGTRATSGSGLRDPGAQPPPAHSATGGGFLPSFLRALAAGGPDEGSGDPGTQGGIHGSDASSRAWEEGAAARLGLGERPAPRSASPDPQEFVGSGVEGEGVRDVEGAPGEPSPGAGPAPPLRNVEGVHPELIRRVERVVERMWSEYGHRVEVVEGHRSQSRQDQLFAQGRTAPGPKVTWTRNSAHTRGEAVDVRIDGGWDDLEGFRRLQVVAREEGIRTLGMKDPGHLELPGRESVHRGGVPHAHAHAHAHAHGSEDPGAGHKGERGDAVRLGPPRVAPVASVARVAAVARPGAPSAASPGATPAVNPGAPAVSGPGWPPATSSPSASTGPLSGDAGLTTASLQASGLGARARAEGTEEGSGHTGSERMSRDGSGTSGPLSTGLELPQLRGLGGLEALPLRVPAGAGPVSEVGQASTLLRAEQIRAIQAASAPGGNLHVDLRNVDGLGTDLHLQMRGRGVSADIGSRDPLDARALRLRLGDLHTRLTDRGLEPERLGVRWVPNEVAGTRDPDRGDGHTARDGGGEPGRQRDGSEQGRSQSDPEDSGADAFLHDLERRRDDH